MKIVRCCPNRRDLIGYRGPGEYGEALKAYENVLRIDPENAEAMTGIALVYLDTKEYDKAIECYDKAVEIYPEHKEACRRCVYGHWR